jgi:hypothetical protein
MIAARIVHVTLFTILLIVHKKQRTVGKPSQARVAELSYELFFKPSPDKRHTRSDISN